MIYDDLWPGGPRFLQSEKVFKLGTDSVLLAHFACMSKVKLACDLGCGGGVLPILLAQKNPAARIHGVDIQTAAVGLARENVAMNGLEDRIEIFLEDFRQSSFPAGGYDLVVSNPPYFSVQSGRPKATSGIAAARDDRCCTLDELARSAAYLTRWGGKFVLVQRPERLSEVFCALTAYGIEPKRLCMIYHKSASPPNLVLVEGRRGGRAGLAIEPPLVLCDDDGGDAPIIRRIYHRP